MNLADEIQKMPFRPRDLVAVIVVFVSIITINFVAVPFRKRGSVRRAYAKFGAKLPEFSASLDKIPHVISCARVVLKVIGIITKFQCRVFFNGVRNLKRVALFFNHIRIVLETIRFVDGFALQRLIPHALIVEFRAVRNLFRRNHEV